MNSQELVLREGGKSFELWKKFPLNFDVYLFNWTNPTNLTKADYEKPIVKQIGPFRFKEITDKTNICFHPNRTVSYRRRSFYYFIEEESAGRLDDKITTLNAIALVSHCSPGEKLNRCSFFNFLLLFECCLVSSNTCKVFRAFEEKAAFANIQPVPADGICEEGGSRASIRGISRRFDRFSARDERAQ